MLNEPVTSAHPQQQSNAMKAKLSDLIEGMEFQSEDNPEYFDRQTGQIVSVSREVLDGLESGDPGALADLPDWQREQVEQATVLAADDGKRFIAPPDKFEFHEYRHMEQFIGAVDDPVIADELWRAIKGRGAFRCFKDMLGRHGLQKKWFRYRDDAARRFVIEWCDANKIEYEDDTVRE